MKPILISMAAGSLLAAAAFAQTHYTVTDLGTFGGTYASAFGINPAGRIAGSAALPAGNQHAFLTGIGGTKFDLGTLGGPNSEASGPNASEAVAILSETGKKDPNGNDFCLFGNNLICLPAIWNGSMTVLPTLGGNNGAALAINDRGQAVGFAETAVKDSTCAPPQVLAYGAVLWQADGTAVPLAPLSGDTVDFTFAMNNTGLVVGSSGTCANTPLFPFPVGPHAVLWKNGGPPIALPNLGGSMVGVGAAVNDQGLVVGGSDLPSEKPGFPFVQIHCTLWTAAGPQDLGTVGNDFSSLPTAMNNSGQIVGGSCDDQGNCRAFLWENGKMTDLNSLIPANSPLYLANAQSINARGEIVGIAVDTATGDTRAFLAVPGNAGGPNSAFEPAGQSAASPRPLPESARRLLRRHLWMGGR